jgi:ferredoxin
MINIDREKCVSCLSCVRGCPMKIIRDTDGKPTVGKEERCIRCGHCTAACPVRAIHFDGVAPEDEYRTSPEDAVEKLIKTRRSVRHFRAETPDRAVIQHALDVAAWAPSGKNIHENGWSILWGRPAVEKARDMAVAWAERTGIYPELPKNAQRGIDLLTCGAPCILIGHSHPKTLNPMLDTAVAMTTAELVLANSGISTCWGGYLRHAINDDPALKEFVGIAPEREVYALVMVGYADRERYPNIPDRPAAQATWVEV